ncbi:preprotein translocase subunit SecE [Francisella philomiragia]|uniref:Protein translocase subunit SecE n=1 Tax=Francisella philomiragia subsp. philomiragia (strain ATCC 25017 / CCUG 19701 / FSC 153 / O\|nr:preprotein translocase subunit SecE [Francisella philomiragia]AJI47193.1 preprotein translocase, SecE subunit [Francisella philomiragia]AJI48656.1 preprotein translocase, SecE subunit [Francisella philomiragia]MBK2020406.1 preprotein translocase subunit SecE [Francisella philomiragia]MBK2030106.1 preprotein translocase subunit SecE [Francisella philomiragia]MBK2263103.1 preprotein translocase subunit SecE [Francisella philomiragia]
MKKNQGLNKVWVSGATKTSEIKKISKSSSLLLWVVSAAIIVFGVAVTMYSDVLGGSYNSYNTSLAVIVVLVALVVARFTNQGRRFWAFFQASKLELAKVVWPTRKETMTISAMVIVVVIIFALIISLFGVIFESFIQYFLG